MHLEAEIKMIALPLQQHEMMKNENLMCGGACKGETIGEKVRKSIGCDIKQQKILVVYPTLNL